MAEAGGPRGEVVVVGGGPGGYAAALGLARNGLKVRLVEADALGGTCLQRGCIPTKVLLEAARLAADAARAADYGVGAGGVAPAVDWPALRARQVRTVAGLEEGLRALLRSAGVRVQRGRARLRSPGSGGAPRVSVQPPAGAPEELVADAVVLAPGAAPVRPPIPGLDLPGVTDSDGLLAAATAPARLCVVGGGAVGCEFASAHADLGARVTVVEAEAQLLPAADAEVARRLAAALRRRGIEVLTRARVLEVTPGPVVRLLDGHGLERRVEADAVLVAVGRRPATADLGLAEAGVVTRADGAIAVDAHAGLQTSARRVWALGDAVGGPMVAHAAFRQAATVVAAISGQPLPPAAPVPQPVFCRPEVGWVGQTEAEAAAAGAAVRVARVPFAALGRAQVAGEPDGLCKLVADAGGRLLGVHLLGPGATELAGAASLALAAGASVGDLAGAVLPHPTLVEVLGEGAALLLGRPLHVVARP